MIKLIFYIIALILILLYVAETNITLNPFSIKFKNGYYAVAIFLVMIGIALAKYQGELNSKKKIKEIVEKIYLEENE